MGDLNPTDAVVHAVAEALRAVPEFAAVAVHKGWPTDKEFALPAMSVDAPRGSWTKDDGRIYRVDDVDGDPDVVDVFFVRARVEQLLQLDFWTTDKTQRMELEPALRELFFPSVPDESTQEPPPPGLMVTIPHHDVTVRVDVVDEQREDAGSARDGYARVSYSLETEIPLLTKVRYRKADYDATVDVGTEVQP